MSRKELEESFYDGLLDTKELEKRHPPVLEKAASLDEVEEEQEQEKEAEVAAPVEVTPLPDPLPRPVTERNLFSHPDAHPVMLDLALLRFFQLEWIPWLADTLFFEIEQRFKTSIAEVNKLKIMAAKTLHGVDAAWDHWEIFEKTVISLNGIIPRLDVMQPPDLPQLYAGVDMMNAIRQEDFSPEVSRYCAAVFLHEGVTFATEPLEFCQQYISQPKYRCNHCKNTGSALPPFDGLCDACVQRFRGDKAFSLRPDPTMMARGAGQDLSYFLERDPQPVKKRYEEFKGMSGEQLSAAIQEVAEDIQAAKLTVAVDYTDFRRGQLKDQLTALRGWLEAS